MNDFDLISPHPLLAPYIKNYWILEADYAAETMERVIPFGNMQLCFYRGEVFCGAERLDAKSLICGQTTHYTDIVTNAKIRIVAVVFHPYGAKAFFSMPMRVFTDLKVFVDDMDDKELKELETKLMEIDNHSECVRLIECFFFNRLSPLREYNLQRLENVMNVINQSGGQTSITALAEVACLSKKQFQRVFSEHVGANPKEFLRTVRFQRLLLLMQCATTPSNFVQLACDCGYYDQAHLIEEFKTFSGYTPKEYLFICTPYSDYFEGL